MLLDDDEDAYSSENASDMKDKVEHASDDSTSPKTHKRKGSRDQDFTESDLAEEEESQDVIMDELENESMSGGSEERRRKKAHFKNKHKRNIRCAELGEEDSEMRNHGEDANTIFIDNLPSDEFRIRKMLGEAKNLVKELEQQFFQEEDSD